MALKTLVKVGNISNLSDARYCAGMGVDLLGFCVTKNAPNFMAPELYQEIRGWVSGPKVVAEAGGLQADDIGPIMENYVPDFFQLPLVEFRRFGDVLPLPCLVEITDWEEPLDIPHSDKVAYLVVSGEAAKRMPPASRQAFPLLISVESTEELEEKLKYPNVKGVSLNGSEEIRPGYKDYGQLADILEALEDS